MNPIRERAAQAVRDLPDSVRVGAFDMAIVKWDAAAAAGAHAFGEFCANTQEIRIQSGMPSPTKAVDTMIHELGHAIYWCFYIEDEDKEERTVGTMSGAWTQVFRDNPWLLDWIKENLS